MPRMPYAPKGDFASYRRSILRILWRAIGVVFLLQVVTVLILQAVSVLRKRKQQVSFSHPHFDEVCVGDNTLQIYDYGQDLYDAMLAAIDAAQENIFLETFIWKDDEVGQAFKDALIRKAATGVNVYIIFDRFANLVVSSTFKVFPSTIHTLQYQAISHPWNLLDPRRFALDHRKLLIVDTKTGFIGGYNLGNLYATSWRDTHLCVNGPVAADLTQSFIDFWNQHAQKPLDLKLHFKRRFDPLVTVIGTNALRLTFPIRDTYLEAIDRAQHRIYLSNAYFVPDSILLAALKNAAKRGVDVRLLVPWISNHVLVDWLARGLFDECLDAGIRIFGYQDMLHAKTCTIDGQWSTIGTANLDRLSSVGNYEINTVIYNETLALQMEQLFSADLTNAFEITQEAWSKRAVYMRAAELVLSPLRILM